MAHMRRRRILKGLSHERGWVRTAENSGASPFVTDLLIEITFSKLNLAGESLKKKTEEILICKMCFYIYS
jgi:hypothetical protein